MKKILATTALALAGIAMAGPAHADAAAGAADVNGTVRSVGDSVTGLMPSPSKEVLMTAIDTAGGIQ
ncbi:hypothetical protein ACWGFX_18130 [Streptomyces xanthophaeus]